MRELLIAAKALIDTPEKWENMPAGMLGALELVAGNSLAQVDAALEALGLVRPSHRQAGRLRTMRSFAPHEDHADIMAIFDRAIAAQEGRS